MNKSRKRMQRVTDLVLSAALIGHSALLAKLTFDDSTVDGLVGQGQINSDVVVTPETSRSVHELPVAVLACVVAAAAVLAAARWLSRKQRAALIVAAAAADIAALMVADWNDLNQVGGNGWLILLWFIVPMSYVTVGLWNLRPSRTESVDVDSHG